jgi:hypothetical protein
MTEESILLISRIRDEHWPLLARIVQEFFRDAPDGMGYDVYTVDRYGQMGHIHFCSEKDLAKRRKIDRKTERVEILQPYIW